MKDVRPIWWHKGSNAQLHVCFALFTFSLFVIRNFYGRYRYVGRGDLRLVNREGVRFVIPQQWDSFVRLSIV